MQGTKKEAAQLEIYYSYCNYNRSLRGISYVVASDLKKIMLQHRALLIPLILPVSDPNI